MKIDQNIANLIAELENIIGNSCYNPNSYDGYTGQEGRAFRYPVYTFKNQTSSKHYRKVELSPEEVNTLKYKFGSNHLLIGKSIVSTLEFIEKKYGIDFNELESKLDESSK